MAKSGERTQTHGWPGEWTFLLRNFVTKDFKIRYRNMSLGVFWSLANPLVMMGVLTFVFRKILAGGPIADFPLFVLTGLVPFNFFSVAWLNGSTSVFDNGGLIKKVGFPREIVPVSSVLGNTVHFGVQTGLLIAFTLFYGKGIHLSWLWLPVESEELYTLDELRLGAQFIEAALAAGRAVLLHGAQGVHRTRPLVAAHLIAQGKSVARVVKELEHKPWLPPYRGQVALLEQLKEQGGEHEPGLHRH